MEKPEGMIKVVNYPVWYGDALKKGILFTERGEKGYPYPLSDGAPPVIAHIGPACKADVAFIGGDGKFLFQKAKEIFPFALSASLSGLRPAIRRYDAYERTFIRALRHGARGMRVIFEKPIFKQDEMIEAKRIMRLGGTAESVLDTGEDVEHANYLLSLSANAVFFSMDKDLHRLAISFLDNGYDVILHSSALSSVYARSLMLEGSPVISSYRELARILDAPYLGELYFSYDGEYSFASASYSFLPFKAENAL